MNVSNEKHVLKQPQHATEQQKEPVGVVSVGPKHVAKLIHVILFTLLFFLRHVER